MRRMAGGQQGSVRDEFGHQAEAFNASPTMSSEAALGGLLAMIPARAGARWLEAAAGPGIISRRLAPGVGSVVALDLTPAMLRVGRREARRAGVDNVHVACGDATQLPFAGATFDGAVTRFSLHHIPLPERVLGEMARVVRPGGAVLTCEHLHSAVADEASWHDEMERLRDPSHWACLSVEAMRRAGREAGLVLEREEQAPFVIDYEEWLNRGSQGAANRALIERSAARRPLDPYFSIRRGRLHLRIGRHLWRRP